MKRRLSLTLAFCFGATALACGDDSDSDPTDTPDASTPDTDTDGTSTDTDATDTDTDTDTDGTSTDTDATDTDTDTDGTSTDTDADSGAPSFSITSPYFEDGDELPDEYTCEGKAFGAGYSPQLDWSGAPEGTLSYALVFKDLTLLPDLPQYAYHWAAWNIPVSVSGIPEGLSVGQFPEELEGGEQHRAGPPQAPEFFGPCPSWATHCEGAPRSTDNYSFTLYAFDLEDLTLPEPEEGENYVAVLDLLFEELAVAVTEVTATSDASPSSAPMCPLEEDGGVVDGGGGGGDEEVVEGGVADGGSLDAGPVTDASTDAGAGDVSTDAGTDAG